MEYNKSLSARIRRRNKQGFIGIGSKSNLIPNLFCGDYNDPAQNHKDVDYAKEQRRKDKLGFKRVIGMNGLHYSLHKRALTKKFADNHQRMS